MLDGQDLNSRLEELAVRVATVLKERGQKIVFAESCTGGKMAAAMTTVPGISASFCGSAVTYREATKTEWLSVAESDLAEHTAESEFTTRKMAQSVLEKTPEADFSVAITGHLGPGVEAAIDGRIFVVLSKRADGSFVFNAAEFRLGGGDRKQRQTEAACFALQHFMDAIATVQN
ncbi:CinA family protein [Mariniblastus fucicola]|uniref:Nicotinamide-nucleotide amidohydrolase PncC n=1 Tax=Mariniblastus fucicola TaxID=980251 RepID=A0A5B9P7T7_9BACT|nr:nicotinamide-nucleotide amidohydrolase family protein [Mariniblastus fucicola]QEG20656.1 Nicotinamide-nucleotide amidohydrolase PncC [Mariniblastus fucicola]